MASGSKKHWSSFGMKWPDKRLTITIGAVSAVIIAIVLIALTFENWWASSPNPGSAPQNPPGITIPPGSTNLQNLTQDFGPWQQLTPSDMAPQTGSPNLLLLQNGAYYMSTKWIIPSGSSSWQQDIGGNVSTVTVNGNHVDITDANGVPYIVGVNQAFVNSNNPEAVLMIGPTGTVDSMTLAQATAIRQKSNK